MQLFVTCAKDADAREVANATKQAGAKVRVVKGNLIVLDIPYSKLEALAEVKGVEIINMPPKMSKKTDVTRQVTQAEEVIDGSAPQLPQAYTGKGVIVGIIDRGFDLTHPMFKDKDGKLRIKGYYSQGNKPSTATASSSPSTTARGTRSPARPSISPKTCSTR